MNGSAPLCGLRPGTVGRAWGRPSSFSGQKRLQNVLYNVNLENRTPQTLASFMIQFNKNGPQPLLRFTSVFAFMLAIGLTGLLSERESGTWIQSNSCSSKPFTFHSIPPPSPGLCEHAAAASVHKVHGCSCSCWRSA